MSDYTIGNGTIKNIANAIRAQEGSSGNIQVSDFASRIAAIVPTTQKTGDIANINTEYYGITNNTILAIGNAIKGQDGQSGPVSGFARRILELEGKGEYLMDRLIVPYYEYECAPANYGRGNYTYTKDFICDITKQDLPSNLLAYDNIDDYNLAMLYVLYTPPGLTRTTGSITINDTGNGYLKLLTDDYQFKVNKTDNGPYTTNNSTSYGGNIGYLYGLVVDQNNHRSISMPCSFKSAHPLFTTILLKAPILYKDIEDLKYIRSYRTDNPTLVQPRSIFYIAESSRSYPLDPTRSKLGLKDNYSNNRILEYTKIGGSGSNYGNAVFSAPITTFIENGKLFKELPFNYEDYESPFIDGVDYNTWRSPDGGRIYVTHIYLN